jgi:hypothetical protein
MMCDNGLTAGEALAAHGVVDVPGECTRAPELLGLQRAEGREVFVHAAGVEVRLLVAGLKSFALDDGAAAHRAPIAFGGRDIHLAGRADEVGGGEGLLEVARICRMIDDVVAAGGDGAGVVEGMAALESNAFVGNVDGIGAFGAHKGRRGRRGGEAKAADAKKKQKWPQQRRLPSWAVSRAGGAEEFAHGREHDWNANQNGLIPIPRSSQMT